MQATTIPVVIRLKNVGPAPRTEWRVETVNHRLLTPALVLSALASAVGATINDHNEMRFRATSKVTLQGHGTHTLIDEGYSPTGVAQLRALSQLRLFDVLEAAYGNPFEQVLPERVEVEIEPFYGREVTELLGAQLVRAELDPGEQARVALTLRNFDGEVEQRVVELDLPASLAGESLEIHILPGDEAQLEHPIPMSFRDLLEIIRAGYPATSLVVSVQRKGRGMSLAGQVVRNLPGSALDALSTANDTGRGPVFVTQSRMVLPMGRVMTGDAKLSLEIRKEKR